MKRLLGGTIALGLIGAAILWLVLRGEEDQSVLPLAMPASVSALRYTPADVRRGESALKDIPPPLPAAVLPLDIVAVPASTIEPAPAADPGTALSLTVGEESSADRVVAPVTAEAPLPPAVAALAEVAAAEAGRSGSTLRGGVVRRSPSVVSGAGSTPPTATPAVEVEELLPWVSGQARGFAMLYLMHPRARAAVEAELATLLRARIRQVYLAALIDGTFSFDLEYLLSVIRRLNEGGRTLTLVLYLSNGPTMRKWDETPITAGFARIDPYVFRDLIRYDPGIRSRYQSMVRRILPAFELNASLNPANYNIAIPMLEDNLEVDSYRAMRGLARDVIGPRAEFIRNPCPGCGISGSDSESLGDGIELHAPKSPAGLTNRDGFTLDGQGYVFPGEAFADQLRIEDVFALIDEAMSRGARYFGLWRERRQGIINDVLPHPDERTYEVATPEHSEIEIQLLRHGLTPEGESEVP